MYSIILCGGSGTRLWPLSRKNFPKQFLALYSDKSLLQETYVRMREVMPAEHVFFVTNYENYYNVFNQVKELESSFPEKNIISEPTGLNTAPAIALGIKYLTEKEGISPEEPIIFLPSDHYIGKKDAYLALVKKAMETVGERIGTIGITPTKPDTGLGYIHKGASVDGYSEVLGFKEKPDLETARKYVDSGEYAWNAGMYLFNAQTFKNELEQYAPEIYKIFSLGYEEFIQNFKNLPAVSVDVAISEKSKNLVVFEGDFGWSDVGSFDILAELLSKQKDLNPRHVEIDSKNVFVHSANNRLIATLGVEDLIVIENNDSILVQKRGKSEDVRKIVEYLKTNNYPELDDIIVGYRPWGKYEVLMEEPNYKVKKITVYPGAKLSLQSHNRRAEHWVVVKGEALAVVGEAEQTLHENESIYIPTTTKHRLSNPGAQNLEIVEVQTGDYLGEDDIERYDDQYKRD